MVIRQKSDALLASQWLHPLNNNMWDLNRYSAYIFILNIIENILPFWYCTVWVSDRAILDCFLWHTYKWDGFQRRSNHPFKFLKPRICNQLTRESKEVSSGSTDLLVIRKVGSWNTSLLRAPEEPEVGAKIFRRGNSWKVHWGGGLSLESSPANFGLEAST